MKLLRHSDFAIQPWKNGGGTTYEIARSPTDAASAKPQGEWDWRVSMAVIASSGPFSHFDGVDRTLVMVEVEVSLLTPRGENTLRPYDLIRFAGEEAITASLRSWVARDLNVLVRRAWGNAKVSIEKTRALVGPAVAIALGDMGALGETESLGTFGLDLHLYDAITLENGETAKLSGATPFLFAEFLMHA